MSAPWSNDTEEEFVSMIETRPELFDNSEMNFTSKTAKMKAWYELSQHFLINERELKKKWDSLRTQYSRYTKMMYGSDGRGSDGRGSDGRFFTPRQQWIMQRLKFLDPYIKRRSNYSTELDYEVTVVENGCEGSPAQVDVEVEADSASRPDLDAPPRPPRQAPKRPCRDDQPDCGTKRVYLEKTVTPIYQKTFSRRPCEEENEDQEEDSDSGSARRDETWDGFSSYVTSCVSRARVREDGDGDGDPQDDLEPFLKSMSIIMRRLPETERSELKFRIHELVHRAQMKHLNEQRNVQNSPRPV